MLSSQTDIQDIFKLAPEWKQLAMHAPADLKVSVQDLLNRVGAKAIYLKALSLAEERGRFLVIVRDSYLQPHLLKMLSSNQNLRRFWSQRRQASDQQKEQVISFSVELAQKMEGALIKRLNQQAEDGFKVLLPAYIQRSVHNAVIDYIRQEWSWERQTLQDMYLDPEQEDPRQAIADDLSLTPENQAISGEQVGQLNELRRELGKMLGDPSVPQDALTVIDCIFALGLTSHSSPGQEMTMRECCDKLNIHGETQARRIARCQVLLDKGLDLIRQRIRERLPGIVDSWQGELNINRASRRELEQQLGMTEGEVNRLVKSRQYLSLDELVDKGVVKPQRIRELAERGAVAAFVPVDVNSATARDLMDILSLTKEAAQKIVSERPYLELKELVQKKLVDEPTLTQIIAQGAVLKTKVQDAKRPDLNVLSRDELEKAGVAGPTVEAMVKARPFTTWSELEEFLGADSPAYILCRQKFCLGLQPG